MGILLRTMTPSPVLLKHGDPGPFAGGPLFPGPLWGGGYFFGGLLELGLVVVEARAFEANGRR